MKKEVPQWVKDGAYKVYASTIETDEMDKIVKSFPRVPIFCFIWAILIGVGTLTTFKGPTFYNLYVIPLIITPCICYFLWCFWMRERYFAKKEQFSNSEEFQKRFLEQVIKECDEYLGLAPQLIEQIKENGPKATVKHIADVEDKMVEKKKIKETASLLLSVA